MVSPAGIELASAPSGFALDRRNEMNTDKIAAVAGTLGLVHGGFGLAEETHQTRMGAMVSVGDKGTASAPAWASLGAVAMRGVRRLLGGRRR
jgi:hypothetical protein